MSTINNGGPAFPIPLQPDQSWQGMAPCDGMTLRDYLAAKAIQGFCANVNTQPTTQNHFDNLAEDAWRMADAMLKAREGGAA